MREDIITPCYVIASNGFRDTVSYVDDWCFGKSEYLGTVTEDLEARTLLHEDIRRHWTERNGIPLYFESDHGNMSRRRAIRLRSQSRRR